MTFRLSLFLGLVASLPSAVLPAARAADGAGQAAASATAISSSPTELSSWKRSDRPLSVDIRFKKPEGVIVKDQPDQPAKKQAASSGDTQPAVGASTTSISSTQASAAVPAQTSATPAATASPPIAAALAPAATVTPIAPVISPPHGESYPVTSAPSSQAPNSKLYTDDQIQLVTQLLIDHGVIPAANDEPLPTAANNGGMKGRANGAGNGNNGQDIIGPGTGECCYDDCNCCPPQPCLFWVGGVEATFLSPDLNKGHASFAVERTTDDDQRFDSFTTDQTDTDSLYISPRIWLGVQGCCWGANVRYWHLQASEGSYDPALGNFNTWDAYDCGVPDIGYFNCNRLEAYTVDLELTRRFCIHNCAMQASLGVRHAELWINESITGLALTDEGLLDGFARANRNSRGTGILLGLYGRRPIFPCSCVNWFYNARWSALWGPTQTSAETFAAVQTTDPNFTASAASINGAYTTIDDTLFIGEIQLGLEWDYCLCCLPANAFFRIAIEYQRWDGGPGVSAANSFAGVTIQQEVDPTSIVSTNALAQGPQMDLFGFSIGTGLTW